MALMANDASDLADQLILLTRRLADLAQAQAALFANNEFVQSSPINDEAGRLAATYALETQRIARHPEILQEAAPHLKTQLRDETKRFKDALAQHERSIERGVLMAEGLVRAIAQEAVAARPTPQAYSPILGGIAPARRDTSAIALDRRA
ncbi:MAG: flagellar basal-body protein FlbY [Hyphomonadaceae bacterium]|nr:MAG: flagellar basal-body protein FlbY [Hyphomonadaceae bacterium]KAF0184356.1 MAG: flagellar basal-body protein FlbY [Hyphomonadaceae bacterium]